MILVDTSIWVDHLGRGVPLLSRLLDDGEVFTHPYVVGEVALGDIPQRRTVLGDLSTLPRAVVATAEELTPFIERHRLFGTGVGYVDAHLLMSVYLTPEATLWTRDRRLHAVARRLNVAADIV